MLVPGTYTLFVRADATDTIPELDEGNNVAVRTVGACTAAGLSTSFVTAEPGDSVEITARVLNTGSAQLPAHLPVSFYQGDPHTGSTLIGTATTTQDLSPGDTEEVSVTWTAATPGDHTITIVANDDGTGSAPVPLCAAPAPVQQVVSILDVPLAEGWNLMSSYVNPFTTDAAVVQRPIAGQYVVIQGFNGGAQSYYPDLPAELNTLKRIDGEHGYWVKVQTTDDGQWTMDDGSSVVRGLSSTVATWRFVGAKWAEDRSIPLDTGWNLVSYLPRASMPITRALASIEGQYFAVLGFDGGALSYYPDIDPIFNTLKTLEPLHGYWIKMVTTGTLQYPVATSALTAEQTMDNGRQTAEGRQPSSIVHRPSSTWINFYGPTSLPAGTLIRAIDPDGVVCGATVVTTQGRYGLLACYGDDPTTSEDEGAQPGDTVRLVVDGQELGTGVWTAHGERQWVPLATVRLWRMWLPLVSRYRLCVTGLRWYNPRGDWLVVEGS